MVFASTQSGRFVVTVEQSEEGQLYIQLPDEILESLNLGEGDMINVDFKVINDFPEPNLN